MTNRYDSGVLLLLIVVLCLFAVQVFASEMVCVRSFSNENQISFQWFPIQRMMVMRKGLRSARVNPEKIEAIVDGSEQRLSVAPKMQDGLLKMAQSDLLNIFPGSKRISVTQTLQRNENQERTSETVKPKVEPKTTQRTHTASTVEAGDVVLVALRHSMRDNHTRVVLEFNNSVEHSTSMDNNVYILKIDGCRNLIPSRRTDPVGRDIRKLDINSGPDRQGLIFRFEMNQSKIEPTIQVVRNPFRMIVAIPSPDALEAQEEPVTQELEHSAEQKKVKQAESKPYESPIEQAPEITIEVSPANITNEAFKTATVVIDPGHGGSDRGFVFGTRPPEKDINLHVARELKTRLNEIGIAAILTRSDDREVPRADRLMIANKYGADLFVAIFTGGSNDPYKGGFACYYYGHEGVFVNQNAKGIQRDAVYASWLKNASFDYSRLLAKRVEQRIISHVTSDSRGVFRMPLLPLKFVVPPAIIVETGMLSEKNAGRNLISDKYRKAIAHAIANGIVDFFNSIQL